jgi:hypothetical protein
MRALATDARAAAAAIAVGTDTLYDAVATQGLPPAAAHQSM